VDLRCSEHQTKFVLTEEMGTLIHRFRSPAAPPVSHQLLLQGWPSPCIIPEQEYVCVCFPHDLPRFVAASSGCLF
jgi:hypothetical protein